MSEMTEKEVSAPLNERKWVTSSFVVVAALVGFLFSKAFISVATYFDWEGKIPNFELVARIGSVVVGFVVFFALFFNSAVQKFTREVVQELDRVTWPTHKETLSSTWVVLVFCLVMGAVLGLLDKLWTQVLQWIL